MMDNFLRFILVKVPAFGVFTSIQPTMEMLHVKSDSQLSKKYFLFASMTAI